MADFRFSSVTAAREWLKLQSASVVKRQLISAEDVAVLAEAYPEDVEVQHRAGSVLSQLGVLDTALRFLQRGLELRPGFHYSELEIAGVHVKAGRVDEAREWFKRAIRSRPKYAPTYLHAARLEMAQKRPHSALPFLQSALALEPTNTSVIHDAFRILIYSDQRVRALDLLRAGERHGALNETLQIELVRLLGQLGLYDELIALTAQLNPRPGSALAATADVEAGQATMARAYDMDSVISRAARRERSERWLHVPAVAQRLRAAIEAARPISLIRFGDGEARFLAHADQDLPYTLSPSHRSAIRNSIWSNWFGTRPDEEQQVRMGDLVRQVRGAIDSADILGVVTAKRLSYDRAHYGYLAYFDGLAEQSVQRRPGAFLTDAGVQKFLHEEDPFLRQMLAGVSWLGTLSPHPKLGERLRRHLGIVGGQDFNIPGEMRLPADDPNLLRGRGHFPARFDELMTALDVPFSGAVVLVAGGMLGKIYCARIRDRGGIAIDIGALADAWMGYATRPGQYVKTDLWRLPQ